jgi:hypothetical protein
LLFSSDKKAGFAWLFYWGIPAAPLFLSRRGQFLLKLQYSPDFSNPVIFASDLK